MILCVFFMVVLLLNIQYFISGFVCNKCGLKAANVDHFTHFYVI